jgi:hypothetical protein
MEKGEERNSDGIQAYPGDSKEEVPQKPITREERTKTQGETEQSAGYGRPAPVDDDVWGAQTDLPPEAMI